MVLSIVDLFKMTVTALFEMNTSAGVSLKPVVRFMAKIMTVVVTREVEWLAVHSKQLQQK